MTMQCLKYPQVQGLCIPSWGLFVNPKKRSNSRGSGRRKRGSYRACPGPLGRGIRQRTKFPGASCGEQLKSPPSVSAKQGRTSFCIVSLEMMYIHPYRINYCDGPISSRARQLNPGIAEVPRASDRNVADQIGTLFRQEGAYTRLVWAKSTSVA